MHLPTGKCDIPGYKYHWSDAIVCVCTGFGFLAVIGYSNILIVDEKNLDNYWARKRFSDNHTLCSATITKLFADEANGITKDELVLIVSSNGGAIYTISIPDPDIPANRLPPPPPVVDKGPSVDIMNMTEDEIMDWAFTKPPPPPKKIARPFTVKQCLIHAGRHGRRLPNINALAFGKGCYSDYILGATDGSNRLSIFVRSYENRELLLWPDHEDAKQVILELIEQQTDPGSLILPLGLEPISETDLKQMRGDIWAEYPRYQKNQIVDSVTVGWAPWPQKSIVAAGTDTNRLIIYDFDAAHALLEEKEPNHVFDFEESQATILFQAQLSSPVRLVKFSPVPSIPILAVAEKGPFLNFIDCRDWSHERIALPQEPKRKTPAEINGLAWKPDASAIIVSLDHGIFYLNVKLVPSLSDRLLLNIIRDKNASLDDIKGDSEMMERAELMSFGFLRNPDGKIDFEVH